MDEIKDKIASRRKALGMTQEQLAKKLGVSAKVVSKWETGRSLPVGRSINLKRRKQHETRIYDTALHRNGVRGLCGANDLRDRCRRAAGRGFFCRMRKRSERISFAGRYDRLQRIAEFKSRRSKVVYDDVGVHDLLHPCCRSEMYDFFYGNGKGHSNCLDNINAALRENRPIIRPVNLFMHTEVYPDGKIKVLPPASRAGDKVVLLAEADLRVGIAACSVSESDCNGGKCSAIKIVIEDGSAENL